MAGAEPANELRFFPEWLALGYAGTMRYLSARQAERGDLRRVFDWARSVLCVGLQYDTPFTYSTQAPTERGWISRYAWGDDYHDVMTTMLEALVERLQGEMGPFRARWYVDTGPIVERAYAAAAGIGAWGKNTCLLHPEHGSWFFLAEVITDLDLEPDRPRSDMCGRCTACLDACPTGALKAPYMLDARHCISYLTIELRDAIPEELRRGLGGHVFGCDICQDVCPWNRKRRRQGSPRFEPREHLVAPELADLAHLEPEGFSELFRSSPVKRAKRRGFLRNLAVALGNRPGRGQRAALERLAGEDEPLIREHALWALRQSGDPAG